MKEFEFIKSLIKPLSGANSLQLSDDCAYFGEYLITKDILSSGTHFFAGDNPFNLARKALRVNLSDLAASGGEPFGFMLGLAVPKGTSDKWLQQFAEGLKSDIAEFNIQLLGGDTVFHDAPLVISVTAIGKTPKPILRSGAQAGDNIFVSGNIGDGYVGLQAKLRGETSPSYELPTPQVKLGIKLRGVANSCIDISDGLLADLWHICEESKLGAEIFSDKIPVSDSSIDLMKLITGGDDYQLLFTSSHKTVEGCTKIGVITEERILKLDGKKTSPKGFEHTA